MLNVKVLQIVDQMKRERERERKRGESGNEPDQINVGREAAEPVNKQNSCQCSGWARERVRLQLPDRFVVAQRHQRLQPRVVFGGFDQLRQEELTVSPLQVRRIVLEQRHQIVKVLHLRL